MILMDLLNILIKNEKWKYIIKIYICFLFNFFVKLNINIYYCYKIKL